MDTPTYATPGKLFCLACGKTTACPAADLVGYMRTKDWPRCCGRVMAFCPLRDQPPAQPTADDTAV